MKSLFNIAAFILDPETQKDVERLALVEQEKARRRDKPINRATAQAVALVRALATRAQAIREETR